MTPPSFVCLDCGHPDSLNNNPTPVQFRIGHETAIRMGYLCDWCAHYPLAVTEWALTKGQLAITTGYVLDGGSVTVISPVR